MSFLEKLKNNLTFRIFLFGIIGGLIGGAVIYIFITEKIERPKVYPLPLIQFFPEFEEKLTKTIGQFPFEVLVQNEEIFISWNEEIKVVRVEMMKGFFIEPLPPALWRERVLSEEIKKRLPSEILEKILQETEFTFLLQAENFEEFIPTKAKDLVEKEVIFEDVFSDIIPETIHHEEVFRSQVLFGTYLVPQPSIFLSPPYKLGFTPKGFKETALDEKELLEIKEGVWYNLTLWGVDKNNRLLWASQNFIKK